MSKAPKGFKRRFDSDTAEILDALKDTASKSQSRTDALLADNMKSISLISASLREGQDAAAGSTAVLKELVAALSNTLVNVIKSNHEETQAVLSEHAEQIQKLISTIEHTHPGGA
jgi:glutamate-1-semialdehyde aminotransferase